MEKKRIDAMKNWLEPKLIRDIQIFPGFTNFYPRFIQGFSKIAVLLISMLGMSLTATLATHKFMNLIDEFDGDNRGENKARKTSASIKGPIGADDLSFNHVSNIIINFARNISN